MTQGDEKKKDKLPPLEPYSMLQKILHNQALSAVILLIAAISAFVIANTHTQVGERTISGWYHWLWHIDLGFYIIDKHVSQSLHIWINDGLMAIFFLLIGLEIKRELMVGELSSIRKAMLPIAAALGGMVVPAAVYMSLNWGEEGFVGWGIPMATDIAFAAGVVGLLSKRVPTSLAVFLIALAIVDDLGAILVIAIFYTESINALSLEVGLFLIGLSFVLARLGVRNTALYTFLAILIWVAFLESGVHATVAGVLFAFTIPVDARYNTPLFIGRVKKLLDRFAEVEDNVHPKLVNEQQQRLVRAIETECTHVEAPLQKIEYKLHPFTAFLIMPLFAFSNSGVELDFSTVGGLILEPVTLGIILGLLVGKQVGIMLFCWLAVALKLAELPQGIRWIHIYGVSWLAGIGFTMSLFIGGLAFGAGDGDAYTVTENILLTESKIGVLLGSAIAATGGTTILWWSTRNNQPVE